MEEISDRFKAALRTSHAVAITADLYVPSSDPLAAANYRAAVLAKGPVSYWRLAEAPGAPLAMDETAAHHATWNGTPGLGELGAVPPDTGLHGGPPGFGYASVAAHADFNRPAAQPFTIEAWARPDKLADLLEYDTAVSATTTNARGWTLDLTRQTAAGRSFWRATMFDNALHAQGVSVDGLIDANPGTWAHLALIWSGAPDYQATLVVNGSPSLPVHVPSYTPDVAAPLWIGRGAPGGVGAGRFYLSGLLDEVAYYPFALTLAQVRENGSFAAIARDAIPVPVAGGSITMDRTAQTRRTGTIEVPATESEVNVRTLPLGAYCDPQRGIAFADRSREYVHLGYLRVDAITLGPLGAATLELTDRMAQIADEQLLFPFSARGMKPTNAIVALVTEVFEQSISYLVETTPASEAALGDTAIYEGDRAAAIAELAAAIPAVAYFNAAGDFVLRAAPSLEAEPVWTLDAGEEGVLVAASESVDRTSTYNGVLLRWQVDADAAPQATLVHDDDPESPLYWEGPFGHVVRIEDSSAVPNSIKAEEIAERLLAETKGLVRSFELEAVPNPALVPGDVIEVILPGAEPEKHIVDAVSIPLTPEGAMQVTTRSVFVPTILAERRQELRTHRALHGAAAWEAIRDARVVAA